MEQFGGLEALAVHEVKGQMEDDPDALSQQMAIALQQNVDGSALLLRRAARSGGRSPRCSRRRIWKGPLRRLADSAAANPEANYFLVMDEINRGNIAKVSGELYFLLEYATARSPCSTATSPSPCRATSSSSAR
ncbi:hypothetical protein [Curtobacterium luteum]|uniref:hypothetical protein n=1 Tax=Curtobacterium luteum TaxID=33881 RepID=UPI0019D3AA38